MWMGVTGMSMKGVRDLGPRACLCGAWKRAFAAPMVPWSGMGSRSGPGGLLEHLRAGGLAFEGAKESRAARGRGVGAADDGAVVERCDYVAFQALDLGGQPGVA